MMFSDKLIEGYIILDRGGNNYLLKDEITWEPLYNFYNKPAVIYNNPEEYKGYEGIVCRIATIIGINDGHNIIRGAL